MTAKTTRKTGGRSRRTKGAGGIIHRADGRWEFRREIGRDPATGKRRFIAASGRTKADARERLARRSPRWSAPACCPEPRART